MVATVEEVTRLVFYPSDVNHAVHVLGVQLIVEIEPFTTGVLRKRQRFECAESLSTAGRADLQQLTLTHAAVICGHKAVNLYLVVVLHAKRSHKGTGNLLRLAPVGVAAGGPKFLATKRGLASTPVGAGAVGTLVEQHDTRVVGREGIVSRPVASRRVFLVVEIPCHDEGDDIERCRHFRVTIDSDDPAQRSTVVLPCQEVSHVVRNDGQRHLCASIIFAVDGFGRQHDLTPLGTITNFVDGQRVGLNRTKHSGYAGVSTNRCGIDGRGGQRGAAIILPLLYLIARQILRREADTGAADGSSAYGRHSHITGIGGVGGGGK